MPRLTDEQKQYISELYLKQGKSVADTIPLFEEKFGYSPSTRQINKWKYFNEPDDDEPEEKPEGKKGKEGELEIETEDTRTVKDDIDFSEGNISDENFDKLCRTFGHSQRKMFDILQKASERGYTKVNATTGEFSK